MVVDTGMIGSGSSRVFDMLNCPVIGLRAGVPSETAVITPVEGKSRKISATRSASPTFDTLIQ